MRAWTAAERARQAALIRQWKPWLKAGVKTTEGKAKSKMNAWKHGAYSQEAKDAKRLIVQCRDVLKSVE